MAYFRRLEFMKMIPQEYFDFLRWKYHQESLVAHFVVAPRKMLLNVHLVHLTPFYLRS